MQGDSVSKYFACWLLYGC